MASRILWAPFSVYLLTGAGPAAAEPPQTMAQAPHKSATVEEQFNRLYQEGYYAECIPLVEGLLKANEDSLGASKAADWLAILAELYDFDGQDAKAATLYERALSLKDSLSGSELSGVENFLEKLDEFYLVRKNYDKRDGILDRLWSIKERRRGYDAEVAQWCDEIAKYYSQLGNNQDKARLYNERHGSIERDLEYPIFKTSRSRSSALRKQQALKRRIAQVQRAHGPNYGMVARLLESLAQLEDPDHAIPLYERLARGVDDQRPQVQAGFLCMLARAYMKAKQYEKAEVTGQYVVAIEEKTSEVGHVYLMIQALDYLAQVHQAMGQYAKAEAEYERAIAMTDMDTKRDDSYLWNDYGSLLRVLGRAEEAELMDREAKRIRPMDRTGSSPE